MKIAVAGTGYVGLSLATLLSQKNEVVALDVIPEKVEMVNNKICPIKDKEIEKQYVVASGDEIKVDADSFTVRMEYGKEFELTFVHEGEKEFVIRGTEREIVVDRSVCGVCEATRDEEIEKYNYDILVAPRFMKNSAHLDIVYDNGFFEIFAENGLSVFSVMTYV